jgi:hypothetical protein
MKLSTAYHACTPGTYTGQFKGEPEPRGGTPSLMSRLKRIKIDAPENFAANLDLYLSGEKSVHPDLR